MKQFPRPMLEELHTRRDALCAAEFPEGPQKDKGKPLPDPAAPAARAGSGLDDKEIQMHRASARAGMEAKANALVDAVAEVTGFSREQLLGRRPAGKCVSGLNLGQPVGTGLPTDGVFHNGYYWSRMPTPEEEEKLMEVLASVQVPIAGDPATEARLGNLMGPTDAEFFGQRSDMEARSLRDLRAEAGAVRYPITAEMRDEMNAYRYRAPGTGISAAEAGTMRAVPQEQWEAMRGALMAAQVELESLTMVFRAYEAHHLAKKTGDSDYKAGVNRAHATRTSALAMRIQEALK